MEAIKGMGLYDLRKRNYGHMGMTASVSQTLEALDLKARFEKELNKALSTEQELVESLEAEGPVRAWQRRAPYKALVS